MTLLKLQWKLEKFQFLECKVYTFFPTKLHKVRKVYVERVVKYWAARISMFGNVWSPYFN